MRLRVCFVAEQRHRVQRVLPSPRARATCSLATKPSPCAARGHHRSRTAGPRELRLQVQRERRAYQRCRAMTHAAGQKAVAGKSRREAPRHREAQLRGAPGAAGPLARSVAALLSAGARPLCGERPQPRRPMERERAAASAGRAPMRVLAYVMTYSLIASAVAGPLALGQSPNGHAAFLNGTHVALPAVTLGGSSFTIEGERVLVQPPRQRPASLRDGCAQAAPSPCWVPSLALLCVRWGGERRGGGGRHPRTAACREGVRVRR